MRGQTSANRLDSDGPKRCAATGWDKRNDGRLSVTRAWLKPLGMSICGCLLLAGSAVAVRHAFVSNQLNFMVQVDPPECQGNDLAAANSALVDARNLMDGSIDALRSSDPVLQQKGQKWLGLRSSSEAESVRNVLVRSRAFAGGVTFLCAVATPAAGGYYAYVRPDKSFAIILGPDFLTAPVTGFSSKAGTLVHEISHFTLTGAAEDPSTYGRQAALALAISDPAAAQRNAENIEYYVEAVGYRL